MHPHRHRNSTSAWTSLTSPRDFSSRFSLQGHGPSLEGKGKGRGSGAGGKWSLLLHNRDADGKGWHRLASFHGVEGIGDAELVRVKCHQRTEFSGWKCKWQQRQCGGAGGETRKEIVVAQGTLNWRKRRALQHTEPADASHRHLIAEPQAHQHSLHTALTSCPFSMVPGTDILCSTLSRLRCACLIFWLHTPRMVAAPWR